MQVEHKTEKGTVLFFKVPDDAKLFELSHFNYQKYEYVDDLTLLFVSSSESQKYNQRDRPHRLLPPGKWKLIGIVAEVTDELSYQMGFDGEIEILDWPANTDIPITREISPSDEFKSLMQNLQVYEVNPYPKPKEGNHELIQNFETYKARTGKWLVLFKPDEK